MSEEKMIWQSDAIEPEIDFGDEIRITSTSGIQEDGLYMLLFDNRNVQPPQARQLCARVYQDIRHITRQPAGQLVLSVANPGYPELNEEVDEAQFLSLWRIAGRVSVVKRNDRGFRTMGGHLPAASGASTAGARKFE
ncbi:hypothetical protein [Castellaniella sp.]|uniref:hypothetical protein n=1 Tax=Castellaniella sp. TaxID=1955812 RepID=UPI003A9284C2